VALVEMLNFLETQHLDELRPDSPRYLHLLTESMKHAFADRARWLGDADFVEVPVERLTSKAYARELADGIDPERTRRDEEYGSHVVPADAGTSHFSVLDAAGNAVACTETVNLTFGSKVMEPRFGIVLNNEMDDFTAVPDVPNAFGLIQGRANAIHPDKKPLSSMTPTIVLEEGRAVWTVGGSGGPRIISATTQVLLNGLVFGLTPREAVAAPRAHHQWQPNTLLLEPGLFDREAEGLRGFEHRVERTEELANVQAASRGPDGLRAASDPRKGGRPAGY
jgi:gamma-glutamyltranspeptidase/glutathione hydrolase